MTTITKKARAKARSRIRHHQRQRREQRLAVGLGAVKTQQGTEQGPLQAPQGTFTLWPANAKEEPATDVAPATFEAAWDALKRRDMVAAYPIWKKLMQAAKLPLDWFSPARKAGESTQ